MAARLVCTPYVLLLSLPGIGVVTAAEFAGEMGPIANTPNDSAITGRAGLFPSRYQSDRIDPDGPLVRRANRELRYVLLLIADNLLHCNSYFRGLGARWREQGVNPRVACVRAAKRFTRIGYRMVAGQEVFRHKSCQGRHAILEKLINFYLDHQSPMERIIADLKAARAQIPPSEYAAEATSLVAMLRSTPHRRRRSGPSRSGKIPHGVLESLGGNHGKIDTEGEDRRHLTSRARGPNNA
jgi:hypothetical protein